MSSWLTKSVQRVLILLCLGSFLGCMGPRKSRPPRRRSTPNPSPEKILPRGASPGPDLRIPADPRPAPPEAPRNVPSRPQARLSAPPNNIIRAQATLEQPDSQAGDPEQDNLSALNRLYQQSVREYSQIDSYISRLTRREWSGGKLQAAEVMLFKHRKQPLSLYFKWLAGPHQGREVVFVEGRYQNKLHTKVAKGDVPFVRAGKILSFSPDSPLVKANSRHDIRDAGLGKLLDRFGMILARMRRKDFSHGKAFYRGQQQHPDLTGVLDCVEIVVPPRVEKTLPRGGKLTCYLSPQTHLPALLVTTDEKNQIVEYYRYDRIQYPVQLDENDFNPNVLWSKTNREG